MDNFIFSPNATSIVPENKYFSTLSNKEFIDNENNPRVSDEQSKNVLAKIKYRPDGSPKYMIRLDNAKRFFNPQSIESDQKNHKLLQTISTNDFKFKEVSSRTFDLYLQFLKTSNIAWINNAEREDR